MTVIFIRINNKHPKLRFNPRNRGLKPKNDNPGKIRRMMVQLKWKPILFKQIKISNLQLNPLQIIMGSYRLLQQA